MAIIIPVAGGKGGVGKSLITANLALALAELGHSTVAVDLDLGGSNLHSFLGLRNNFPGIGDFLKARSAQLEELLAPTALPHLKFLPGDGRTPLMANIPYAQKMRLISHLKRIPADYILLDIGSGSTFNTLDFFNLSSQGLLVTTSEYTAIMNMMTFLKNMVFRAIKKSTQKNSLIRQLLDQLYTQPMTENPLVTQSLQIQIAEIDPKIGADVKKICDTYRPRLIYNMVRHPKELDSIRTIESNLKESLSLQIEHFGCIFADQTIWGLTNKSLSLIPHYQDSVIAKNIFHIADRIVRLWDKPIKNSAELLLNDVKKNYSSKTKDEKS